MKKVYKRLLIFELILIIILLLNNFISGILSGYVKSGFLILTLLIFRLLFGFEKDRHRYWKTICLEVGIFLLIYFLVYYLSGLIFSFYEPINYWTLNIFIKIIIPIIISIIVGEILRYMMICRAEGSRILMILTCIVFILVDLLNSYELSTFKEPYTIFMFLAIKLLPCISKNILCSYISYKTGYKPAIMYSLVMSLYIYLLPIIPNPNEYIYALLQLIAPFILLYRLSIFYKIDKDEKIEFRRDKYKILSLIPASVIMTIIVYFTCGYFQYHAIVIGSGSMMPNISKGDVVVIKKIHDSYGDLKTGQILAVKNDGVIVVHRLVKKINVDEQYYFYTKGDANNDIDSYKITTDMIYGIVDKKIPYIGIPTVWLKNI